MSIFKSPPKTQLVAAKSPLRIILLVVIMILVLLASSKPSLGDAPPPRMPFFGPDVGTATAEELAAAMDIPASDIVSVSYGDSDPAGTHVFDSQISGFPTNGNSFAVLSSGNAANSTLPNDSGGLSGVLNGLNNSQGNDLVQLTMTLRVPPGARFWALDWKFFSEEYPEFVGSSFNDAFLIETSTTNFTISGNTVTAPNNVAFDPSDELVTINTTGATGMQAANANGTTYDGSTTKLVTASPIPPGATELTLIFSIMDLGDSILDTSVFLDNFRFVAQEPPAVSAATIHVPVKWCAIEGSPAANNINVLTQRMQRIGNNFYLPRASITFDSAVPSGVQFEVFGDNIGNDDSNCEQDEVCSSNFPVIRDPRPNGPGVLGDVEQGSNEENQAWNNCNQLWNAALSRAGYSASTGIVAVNVRLLVENNGNTSGVLGQAAIATLGDLPIGLLAVRDYSFLSGFPNYDTRDLVLAHEAGHILSLPHMEGISNILNLMYDTYIPLLDQDRLTRNAADIDDLSTQVGQARSQAIRYIGVTVDPPAQYIDPPLGDSVFALANDLPDSESFIDLTEIGLVIDQQNSEASFYEIVLSTIPDDIVGLRYWFLLDSDGNPASGATMPEINSEIGIPVNFEGADYVFYVNVSATNGIIDAVPVARRYESGSFVTIADQSIQAEIGEIDLDYMLEDGASSPGSLNNPQQIIALRIDNSLIGTLTNPRLKGGAQNLNTLAADLPNEKTLSFDVPTYPSCITNPATATPGDVSIVAANSLLQNNSVDVFIGEQLVSSSIADDQGNLVVPFVVPANTDAGNRLVTVRSQNTAVFASCSLLITNPPEFDVPPSPPAGSEFVVNTGSTFNISIQASDPDVGNVVALGIIDAPTGANFTSTPSNPATGTFSWQPTVGQEGVYIIPFTATDNHGVAAQPRSIVITVQTTNQPPVADANGPYSATEGSLVILDGTNSFDPDGDLLDYSWDFGDGTLTNGPTVDHIFGDNGVYMVSLMVTDPAGLSSIDQTTVEVVNVAPLANAGPDQAVYRNEVVWLTGTWGDPAGVLDEPYSWSWDTDGDGFSNESGTAAFGESADTTASFSLEGFYTLSFAVTDKDLGVGIDDMVVEVLNRPPVCTNAAPSIATLWPVNRAFVPINVLGITDPEGDTISINIDGIYQDEAVDAPGTGNTSPDGQGVGMATAEIRAERAGSGNGRVYHIYFTADDGHGGICSGQVLVGVPKSQGKKGDPIDDGPLYDSTTP